MLTYDRPMRLAEAMNRLFDDSFVGRPSGLDYDGHYALPVDVSMLDDEYVITAAVPGLKPEDLSLEVLGDTVTVRGEVRRPQGADKTQLLLQERRYGKFARRLTLPTELSGAQAEAHIEDGILTLRIPKAETARPKQIKVRTK